MTVDEPLRTVSIDLVERWVRARQTGTGLFVADPPTVAVPAALAETVTAREPWRSEALEDARYFLARSMFYGWGAEILVDAHLRAESYDGWELSIAPLKFRVEWSRSIGMGGDEVDFYDDRFERVALEDGQWRVVQLWKAGARDRLENAAELFKR